MDLIKTLYEAYSGVTRDRAATIADKKREAAMVAHAKGVQLDLSQEGSAEFANKELAAVYDFILDRLRSYYADKGVPAQHFAAVAELRPASLYEFDTRLDAIGQFAALPEAEALAAANKRINNILKKADVEIPAHVDPALLTDPAESALAAAVEAAIGETDEALQRHDYVRVLSRLALLRPQVDAFFESVMVNVEDPALRANRLALLKRLADRFRAVAAIEHLST